MRWRAAVGFLGASVGLYSGPAVAAGSPVHLLRPGFEVAELPVRIGRPKCLRFGPDGVLTVLDEDGRICRLRDGDGDGLEDRAEPYWDRPGLSGALGVAWSTQGAVVLSKGKVSLLRDVDGDARGDREEVLASGWPEADAESGGWDAAAVVLDQQGRVYFGLRGIRDADPYRLRKRRDLKPSEVAWLRDAGRWREPAGLDSSDDEFSLYDPDAPRGSIQRWDPSSRKLETFAMGFRAPSGLAFNPSGDLFSIDGRTRPGKSGATVEDSLCRVQQGRHGGWPPHHPKWLPALYDEPPVVEFGLRHLGACALVFNSPHEPFPAAGSNGDGFVRAVPLQGHFGPESWAGDAIVAGGARGLISRVRVAHSEEGYLGRCETIARVEASVADLAISPRGDLYLCCQMDRPGRGSGPRRDGCLFRIRYIGASEPQPVAVWSASPTEVRITFDQPLDPVITNRLSKVVIEFGEHLTAGDEPEALRSRDASVGQLAVAPRGRLRVRGVDLVDGARTLVLMTDPHERAVNHVVKLAWAVPRSGNSTMELEYDLTGGEMELWKLNQTPSRLWLPHPDIRISRHWMRDSWPHQNFYDRVQNHAPFLKWSSLYSPGEGEHRIAFPPANGIRFKWKFDHPTDPKTRESGRLLMSGWGGAWHDHYYDSWIRIQRLPGTRLSNLPLNWSLVPWAPVSTEPVGTGAAPKTTSPGP